MKYYLHHVHIDNKTTEKIEQHIDLSAEDAMIINNLYAIGMILHDIYYLLKRGEIGSEISIDHF